MGSTKDVPAGEQLSANIRSLTGRFLLQLLLANRFLTIQEIIDILDFYEDKVGMKDWYKD